VLEPILLIQRPGGGITVLGKGAVVHCELLIEGRFREIDLTGENALKELAVYPDLTFLRKRAEAHAHTNGQTQI